MSTLLIARFFNGKILSGCGLQSTRIRSIVPASNSIRSPSWIRPFSAVASMPREGPFQADGAEKKEAGKEFEYDLFVIGIGSGGVRAARIAASYGAKV
jgi:hypothetical protein